MRKIVSGLFMALDGVVEAPNTWQEHFDEDMGEAMMAQLNAQDAVLLGRVTYEEWALYWPTATDEPFASYIVIDNYRIHFAKPVLALLAAHR